MTSKATTMKPTFKPGKNIALKVPTHEFEKTVHFYSTVLGLEQIEGTSPDTFSSATFAFGDKNLWVDCIAGISQAEVWLEIDTDDVAGAKAYLVEQGCTLRDEIEPLPKDFNGFWLSNPSNIIHLVNG